MGWRSRNANVAKKLNAGTSLQEEGWAPHGLRSRKPIGKPPTRGRKAKAMVPELMKRDSHAFDS